MPAVTVRAADARRTETPVATMTTLGSPTLSGTTQLAMWEVRMGDGVRGPVHVFDSEQVWTVLAGVLEAVVGDERVELAAGDSITMPPEVPRRVTAIGATRAMVCGRGDAVASVPGEAAARGVPPWIA